MEIQLTVIEDLGFKLYTQLPSVLAEMVANCWDADAKSAEISVPEGDIDDKSVISIKDDGCGMTYEEIQDKYLVVGRKRREEEKNEKTARLQRDLMGRKGIGKLSVFGVAKLVQVDTVRNHTVTSFLMDIDDILREARETGSYEPVVKTADKSAEIEEGTTIWLSRLKRKTPINVESVRRELARHFSVIGKDFRLSVNGLAITPTDKFRKSDMQYSWDIDNESLDPTHPEWTVSGWLGTTELPLDEGERGIVIMARGKLLQTPTAFQVKVGEKYSYSYLVGELHAEFLDQTEDLISTDRQSLIWESPQGAALKDWGQKKLKEITDTWVKDRRDKREKVIREDPEYKEWLKRLPPAESKIADKVIRVITSGESLNDERRKELATYMKESFDQKVFQEMANSLGDNPEDVKILEIFEEWDIIEAREILRLVEGRLYNIQRFERLIKSDAKEKPTVHDFFKKWPWLLDPSWTRWRDEVHYSKLLRDNFPDDTLDENDRRIDFLCIGAGDTVHVVELKRPKHHVNDKDLDQLLEYVTFVRERLGNVPERGYRDAAGYIVAGELSKDRKTVGKKKIFEKDRLYVKRYDDIIVVARQLHQEFEDKLNEFEKQRNSLPEKR